MRRAYLGVEVRGHRVQVNLVVFIIHIGVELGYLTFLVGKLALCSKKVSLDFFTAVVALREERLLREKSGIIRGDGDATSNAG